MEFERVVYQYMVASVFESCAFKISGPETE